MARHPYPTLHRLVLKDGWRHRISGSGHHQYRPPLDRPDAPPLLTMPGSPSDWRSRRNAERDVRKWAGPRVDTQVIPEQKD